jgi:hypothetical protein
MQMIIFFLRNNDLFAIRIASLLSEFFQNQPLRHRTIAFTKTSRAFYFHQFTPAFSNFASQFSEG